MDLVLNHSYNTNLRLNIMRIFRNIMIVFMSFIALYMLISWYIVNESLKAESNDIVHTPLEYGLAFEEISFTPRGEKHISLSGWWIPQENSKDKNTIIWVHGLDGSKDTRMEFLYDLYRAGYNVFTFDLRGHGESDIVPMGAGQHEQRDVQGAIDLLIEDKKAKSIGLIGISLGGAIVILSGDDPSVVAVIADSSFASIPELMEQEVSARTSLPPFGVSLLKPGLILGARWFKGVDLLGVNPQRFVSKIKFPIALIHCKDSERVPIGHAERIQKNMPERSKSLIISGCDHGGAYDYDKGKYLTFVFNYLEERFGE